MTAPKNVLRFFLDEGVPDSVGRELMHAGHEVIYLRNSIATGSPDELVCVAAMENEAILVAMDGDMKQIAKKWGVSNTRYKRLSLLKISCSAPTAAPRVEQAMSLVEHEWEISKKKVARRLFIEIQTNVIRTIR